MANNPTAYSDTLKGNLYLLMATVAWGTTFVVQRTGMEHLGPFSFSGLRFFIGALFLFPFVIHRFRKGKIMPFTTLNAYWRLAVRASLLTGFLVFAGINLQQIGLISSTAGKGGFITGLYVIIVPIIGMFFGYRPGPAVWTGAVLAVMGLYLLSVTSSLFTLSPGDGWILSCAFVWAFQVLALSRLSPRLDSFVLAFGQALVCALLSLAAALIFEDISLAAIGDAAFDLAYGGIVSVGLGFTLQVVGQKHASASHASIIMQFEAVIAAASGWYFLGEALHLRGLIGCGLMLTGMLIAGLWGTEEQTFKRIP